MKRLFLIAAALALGACSTSGSDDNRQKTGALSLFDPIESDPTLTSPIIPFPFDGLFSGFSDPTLNIPNAGAVPFVDDANLTDGFSTTASIFTDLVGFVNFATANNGGVVVIDGSTGQPLVPGTDFLVQPSPALEAGVPIMQTRSRLLIEPLRPLKPSTTYLVALTNVLASTDGLPAKASDLFKVVRSATPVSQQTASVLTVLSPLQLGTLEALRSQLIRPTVVAIEQITQLPEDDLLLAWSFTTESTTKTLQLMNDAAVAHAIAAAPTGLTTHDISAALPAVADVWAGTFTLPYYLANSGGNIHSPAPLGGYWLADATQPDTNASFLGEVPCGAFAIGAPLPGGLTAQPSVSTTACFPMPVKRSDETVPMLVTVPNAASGQTKPAGGWPVVIFQHGITADRTSMFGIAPTLAAAGFVTVAIDLPLHGITNSANPFYGNQLFNGTPASGLMTGERTFDLDLLNNTTGALGSPDGVTDGSGSWFINLASLITSRDNLRQSAIDVINLAKSVGALDLDGNAATTDIDGTRIYFVGHSLGGIIGTEVLGVNTDIRAASLAMPGGGLAKLLDASKAFGPRISAGLALEGVAEGTDDYETFDRFAQHLVDPGDPVNYAVAAAANHPLQMIEVIGDLVVPNAAPATPSPTATLDTVTIAGYLSGTDPLAALMGLDVFGPITPPGTAAAGGPGTVVQFAAGTAEHSTVLTPDSSAVAGPDATFLPATCEMQREIAQFLATDGVQFQIGGTCP